ncbi:hypothetical protein KBT16_11895, partial [Nostoc sp. CCCryo 231-06]|nr:hypothetical protein [Nostoc sp. CCCryo 231-06]
DYRSRHCTWYSKSVWVVHGTNLLRLRKSYNKMAIALFECLIFSSGVVVFWQDSQTIFLFQQELYGLLKASLPCKERNNAKISLCAMPAVLAILCTNS